MNMSRCRVDCFRSRGGRPPLQRTGGLPGLPACLMLAVLIGSFSGCAALPVSDSATVSIDRFPAYIAVDGSEIFPASVDESIADVDILSVNESMKSMLDASVSPVRDPKKRLDTLVGVILDKVQYNTEADKYGTKTARETFETGTGNCLSFSNLFVAMARYVGFKAEFQEIPTQPNWVKNGEVLFFTRHIGATVDVPDRGGSTIQINDESGNTVVIWKDPARYLFAPTRLDPTTPDINPFTIRRVSDARAFAQYYNNIGSRYLAQGDTENAFRYFVKAVRTDPALSFAWSNLGVAYRRNNQFEAARAAMEKGLSMIHDQDDVTAMSIMGNLARLYAAGGQTEQAAYYEKKVAVFRDRNPYYHYSLGKIAYDDALFELSVRHFKAAVSRKEDEPLFYYAMFLAYLRIGDTPKAERSIDRAKDYAWDDAQRNFYDRIKEKLISGAVPAVHP